MFTAHRAISLKIEKDNGATRMDKVCGGKNNKTHTLAQTHACVRSRKKKQRRQRAPARDKEENDSDLPVSKS